MTPTPKDKALQIFDDVKAVSFQSDNYIKDCCLVAIQLLIESTFSKEKSWDIWGILPADYCTSEYWVEVKKELQLL